MTSIGFFKLKSIFNYIIFQGKLYFTVEKQRKNASLAYKLLTNYTRLKCKPPEKSNLIQGPQKLLQVVCNWAQDAPQLNTQVFHAQKRGLALLFGKLTCTTYKMGWEDTTVAAPLVVPILLN